MRKSLENRANKLSKILFYVCYTGITAHFLFQAIPDIAAPLWAIYRISLALLIPVCLFAIRKLPKKTLAWIALIAILVIINRIITGCDDFAVIFLLIVAAKGISFSKIVKYDLCMKIPVLIILPILYYSGATNVYLHYRGDIVRESMGFYNPNFFSSYLMSAVMEIIYLRRDKIGWKEILLATASCGVIGYFTDSRTQMACIIVLGISLLVIKSRRIKQIKNAVLKFLIFNSAFILAFFSLGTSMLYLNDPTGYETLNRYTSRRMEMSADVIRKYGVSAIGNKQSAAANLTEKTITVDNTYVYIFSVHGTLSLLVYCILMRKYFKYTNSRQEIVLLLIMLCFTASGLAMKACMRPRFNVFLLYFAYLLYGPPDEESEKIEEKIDA